MNTRSRLRVPYLAFVATAILLFLGQAAQAKPFAGLGSDKTLVVWVLPANVTQRGGSALTIEDGRGRFDAVVFGEVAERRWMAGSEMYLRSLKNQEPVPVETLDDASFVQIAIVYAGNEVTLVRNGKVLSRHSIKEPLTFPNNSPVLFGLRHLDAADRACFAGVIDDARIYDVALTHEQLLALRPNVPSEPMPLAWWNFEQGTEDSQGAFPPGKLVGQAKVDGGKLVLDGKGSYMLSPPDADVKKAEPPSIVPESLVLNYHLMHPGKESMPGDPNAAFYLDGTYHLHYILAHPWRGANSFSFIHVTSPDMLHWQWKATKLHPGFTGHGMFSGTGFLTKDGKPAAIYHGQGSNRNQIAIAKDRGLSGWEKPYPIEVKNADGTPAEISHWDPDCFQIGDTYYAISGGTNPPLFRSKDLKQWTLVGDFVRSQPPDVVIGEDISCPNFFKLGDQWMLLCISHPLGCRYYLGDWDASKEQFVPKRHGRMNWARLDQPTWGLFTRTDFFAPETVLTPDGRRVMWAWVTSAGKGSPLLNKTIQALPRELSLAEDGVLRIKPLRELEGQRLAPRTMTNVRLNHPIQGFTSKVPPTGEPELQRIAELPSDAVEIRLTIPRAEVDRKMVGFMLFSDGRGEGLPILLRPENGTLRVGETEVPFAVHRLPDGQDLELRIFVDKYLVEVFANDLQAVVAADLEHANRRGFDGFTVGGPTTLSKVEIWQLKPTNQGFRDAMARNDWQPPTD